MMNTQANAPSGATTPTSGTRNGRGRAGIRVTEHDDTQTDEREREQRPDVGQVVCLRGVTHERRKRDDDAGERRGHVRDSVLGVDARRPFRQQAVARHGKENPRLPILEHQEHRRHRHRRAERDDPPDALETGRLEGVCERVGRGGELTVRHHSREHRPDHDIDDGADGQTTENPDRQVALRVHGLLRGGRDRVEPDVGEEHDRGALVDAGEPVRRERVVVGRIDVRETDDHEQRERCQLHGHHDVVRLAALARAPEQQPGNRHHDPERG